MEIGLDTFGNSVQPFRAFTFSVLSTRAFFTTAFSVSIVWSYTFKGTGKGWPSLPP